MGKYFSLPFLSGERDKYIVVKITVNCVFSIFYVRHDNSIVGICQTKIAFIFLCSFLNGFSCWLLNYFTVDNNLSFKLSSGYFTQINNFVSLLTLFFQVLVFQEFSSFSPPSCNGKGIYIYNKCSDRNMDMKFLVLLENYDRQTNRRPDKSRPTD